MSKIELKFYSRPETIKFAVRSRNVILTSANLNSLSEDTSDSEEDYTQF